MDFMPFYTRYAELAGEETRTITIIKTDGGIPPGEYGFIEYYCTDKTCDCHKAMLNVIKSSPPHEVLATIGYGWESTAFYTKWMHGDEKLGRMMTGAYLEITCTQSQYSQKFLELFKTEVLDDEYAERLERHYNLFKSYGYGTTANFRPISMGKKKKRR